MLDFENSQDLDLALETMRSIDGRKDYLQEVLFPALLRGDWDELEKSVIYQDKKDYFVF
ncbi:hypothetical protein QWY96_07160 [Vibrio artabrorum]|uniref:Uncharacterized protein n=1 Tax=Vibrio artabrorum TaxID=446374 RepID=A0ABT8CG71_9VIBR|nr:hypothetical protein [Vibrio artabrorum]MDN3700727.1 hypothetical protein [Vibrio artabrorum]